MQKGSLTVIGTGIKLGSHLTTESMAQLQGAEKVLFITADMLNAAHIKRVRPDAESFCYYLDGKPRMDTYNTWVDHMLSYVRKGYKVCAVFYGHPGVFVYASHKAISLARSEGFKANMLPGISAVDCLFADLGVDPAEYGYQSYSATQFLKRKVQPNTGASLVLWQLGLIGEAGFNGQDGCNWKGVSQLEDALITYYGEDHNVTLYSAAQVPIFEPSIEHVTVGKLETANISHITTLYIPPVIPTSVNVN